MGTAKDLSTKPPSKKATSQPLLRLIGFEVGLPGEVLNSNYELSWNTAPETTQTKPVEIKKMYKVPKNFEVGFFYESLTIGKKLRWRVIFQIQVSDDGTPNTKDISITGDNFAKEPQHIYKDSNRGERVNSEALFLVGRSLRKLEVRALTLALQTFRYFNDSQIKGEGTWTNNFMTLSKKEIRAIEKDTLNRVSYKKNSPEFLKQISKLYQDAEKAGLPPVKFIQDEIGTQELRNVERRTAENWVRVARAKEHLPKKAAIATKNSSPTKSVKDARKPKTTNKIGEK